MCDAADTSEGRTAPRVLVVEDEPRLASGIKRAFRVTPEVQVVSTVAAALEFLSPAYEWSALIVDVGLPDGSGLDVVRAAREALPLLPILVLTGRHDHHTINEAHRLRAHFQCKPVDLRDLVDFVNEAQGLANIPDERLAQAVDDVVRECALTPREASLVRASLFEPSRHELVSQLGVSENTLKTHVKRVLKKTGHDSLHSLRVALLRNLLTR